jgi:hypothetical protein
VPERLRGRSGDELAERDLNSLNESLLDVLQRGGDCYPSNAVVNGRYALRACIVNFHTTFDDVRALPEIVVREGRKLSR